MTRSAARITRPPSPDTVFYGWRYVKTVRADGTEDLKEIPLTLEDVLHPQEGDVIPERTLQERDARYLADVFQPRAARLPGGLLLADCLVNWGVPGIRNHSPDISVFRDVTHRPPENVGLFHLRDSGGRCVVVVEIVSPHTRVNDVEHKRDHYHRVQVPLYVLIDQVVENVPRELIGYRYTAARYVRMRLDPQGRLLLKPLGLLLALEDQRAVCYDAKTGQRIRAYRELEEAHLAAEQRLRDLEAELRRLKGQ